MLNNDGNEVPRRRSHAAYPLLALAWASHISIDRPLGYGLRTRDGFQRR